MMNDPGITEKMQKAALAFGVRDAGAKIADMLVAIAKSHGN